MSRRTWFPNATWTAQGLVHCLFSFVTNNTSDPDATVFRGCGGLTGTDPTGLSINSGPGAVTSITRTGVGAYLITFSEGYRYAVFKTAQIEDGTDGLAAGCAAVSNEGSGATTACTMAVTIRAAGTATESTGRRVSVYVAFKDSGAGT